MDSIYDSLSLLGRKYFEILVTGKLEIIRFLILKICDDGCRNLHLK
jgi:hypothetical protein